MIDRDGKYLIIKLLAFGIVFAFVAGIACRAALVTVHAAAPSETTTEAVTATPSDATSSDAVDRHPYLSQNSINGDTMSMLDLLLSIRNVLVVFLMFEFLKWAHSILKGVINGFHKKR